MKLINIPTLSSCIASSNKTARIEGIMSEPVISIMARNRCARKNKEGDQPRTSLPFDRILAGKRIWREMDSASHLDGWCLSGLHFLLSSVGSAPAPKRLCTFFPALVGNWPLRLTSNDVVKTELLGTYSIRGSCASTQFKAL